MTAQNLESLHLISGRNKYRKACLNAFDPGGHRCRFHWDRAGKMILHSPRINPGLKRNLRNILAQSLLVKRENSNSGLKDIGLKKKIKFPKLDLTLASPIPCPCSPLHTFTQHEHAQEFPSYTRKQPLLATVCKTQTSKKP